MLTDKTKEAFENWAIENKLAEYTLGQFTVNINRFLCDWDKIPFSMQYGVMVDFFDENGISVNVFSFRETINTLKYHYEIVINGQKGLYENPTALNTLSEARKNAILKANNLYNNGNI